MKRVVALAYRFEKQQRTFGKAVFYRILIGKTGKKRRQVRGRNPPRDQVLNPVFWPVFFVTIGFIGGGGNLLILL